MLLIEVLFAFCLLCLVVIAAGGLLLKTAQMSEDNRGRLLALQAAQSALEAIKDTPLISRATINPAAFTKEIKHVHVGIAMVLVLLSLAIVQWITRPPSSPPPATELTSTETDEPEEFPVLPQNELYNSPVGPSFSKDLPPFKESPGTDHLEPKDEATAGKALL